MRSVVSPAAYIPPDEPLLWVQGADLTLGLDLTEGPDENTQTPVDLTGYTFRMDIAEAYGDIALYTFNSATIADKDPVTPGAQPDTTLEITSADPTEGQFDIVVPRALTLPTGAIYAVLNPDPNELTMLVFDVFIRTPGNKQDKLLKGWIAVERSVTLWT